MSQGSVVTVDGDTGGAKHGIIVISDTFGSQGAGAL